MAWLFSASGSKQLNPEMEMQYFILIPGGKWTSYPKQQQVKQAATM